MFQWDTEKLIDLACMDGVEVSDIARTMGASVSSVEKQLQRIRGEIVAAKKDIQVSERILIRVLDLWYDHVSEAKIATTTNLSLNAVRRIIRMAKLDEQLPNSDSASACADSLAALQAAFPNKFYEEDPRAEREYAGAPVFLLAADCYERCAA
jgi:hypothetical protein